jgi:steroid delta-isomerase-like uncharacterized protein
MRRAILTIALAVLVLSPLATVQVAAQEATPAACAPASRDEMTATALDWYRAIGDRDLSRFDDLMTPGTVYRSATSGDSTGVEFPRGLYQSALDGFSNLVYEPADIAAAGDHVAVRFTASGNHTGDFHGAAPTGKTVTWDGIGIMRFECGRIAETWMEIDQVSRMWQIGTAADVPVVRSRLDSGHRDAAGTVATPPACPPADEREASQVLFLWLEVWSTGDTALLDGLLTGDDGDAGVGDDLAASVMAYRAAIPDLGDEIELVIADGDLVVARWTATGTMTGEFDGVPPSGGPIRYAGITMLRLECGRIAQAWSESDQATMLDQMGADWRAEP